MKLKKEIAGWGCCLLLLGLSGSFNSAQAAPPSAAPAPAGAVTIADYTAFPPFLPRVVSPNILFLLDYSKSMVRPAYGVCNAGLANCRTSFNITTDDFDSTISYSGYFGETSKYSCTTGVSGSCQKAAAGPWDGNWLNWMMMTQYDVLKKVVVGGDITASPEMGNPTKLRSLLLSNVPIIKAADLDKCVGKSPDCTTWPAIVYDVNYFNSTGASVVAKESNAVPANPADMVVNKLYRVAAYDAGDEGMAKIPLPFTFSFFSNNYTQIFAHSNGILSFDFATINRETFSFIGDNYLIGADGNNFNNLIAPYWDDQDLSLASSKIWYKTFGVAPNRVFAITYEEITPYPSTSYTGGGATYQVLFYEGSNHIVFQYKDLLATDSLGVSTAMNGDYAIAGVENADGTKGKVLSPLDATNLTAPSAAFVSPHIAYSITPDGSKPTTFKTMAPLPTIGNVYSVNIDLKNTPKVSGLCPTGFIENKYNKNCYDHVTDGLLQEFRDGELSGLLGFRLGIMEVDNGQQNGGKVVKHFNEKDETGWASLMAATRGRAPSVEAPLGESLYEALGYFKQDSAFMMRNGDWTNNGTAATCAATGNNYDPYCFQSAAQKVPCAKSYVLLVSSGNYSHDNTTNIYGDPANAETWTNTWSLGWRSTGEASGSEGTKINGGWADNVVYKLRTTDLRTEVDALGNEMLPGNQSPGVYAVNTFGSGSGDGGAILSRIARYGGFIDSNGNGSYDSGEDDKNGDGVPDTYFEASGGGDLRAQIVAAVMDILKNSASGTSVSVLSTSAGGEGALYQAYFYPAKILNQTEERRWPGYMRAFFIDRYQNLHDDHSNIAPAGASSPDAALVLQQDHVTRMRLNPSDNAVVLDLFSDTDGDGIIKNVNGSTEEDVIDTVSMDEVVSLWEAGTSLAGQDKGNRHIYLWLDRDGDGQVEDGAGADFGSPSDSSETVRVSTSLASDLVPYLRAKDNIYDTVAGYNAATDTLAATESANLINFLVGNHVETNESGNHQSYRNRCLYVLDPTSALSDELGCSSDNAPSGTKARVWPLGDIVFSTPTLVAGPTEAYDKIYNDVDYVAFRSAYKSRRNMVYVGANDGLLHAFNAGVYHQGDDYSTTGKKEFGWFKANPDSGNGWTSPLPKLGDELWSFLPYDNLPHLPWLTCNGTDKDPAACYNSEYTHVYYTDQRPKVTDVRMFNDTATSFAGGIEGQSGASHPGGWGTILILPLRFGGGAMDVAADFDGNTGTTETRQFRSAFYAFDITDPEKPPKLLWRFTHANLGFSTSYPAVAHIKSGSTEKWFMVVGSGPDNNPPTGSRAYGFASSAQDGKIFVVDIANGSATMLDADASISARQVMSDPTVVDVDRDFNADVIYIGSTINPTGDETDPTYGRIYRINTRVNATASPDLTPANWTVSSFVDADPSAFAADPDTNQELGPVVVAPSASKDNLGNLWVYFGTGQLRNRGDMSNSDQQRFYGVKDFCWKSSVGCVAAATATAPAKKVTTGLADLMNTTNVKVLELSPTITSNKQVQIPTAEAGANSACGLSATLSPLTECSYTTFKNNVQKKNGWYVVLNNPADPNPSERVLSKSSIIGGVVLFTSYKPSGDLCSIFGDSFLNSFYYETGAAYGTSVIGSHLENAAGDILTDANGLPLQGDYFKLNASGQLVAQEGSGYTAGTVMASDTKKVFDTKVSLGQGMPTSVGLAVGESTTGFVQQSTGEIKQIRTDPVFKIKSGPTSWREQPTGDGTSGVEMIYRHISK